MLNSVCAAGLRLSQSLNALSGSQNAALSSQCTHAWDELSRATVAATHSVRAHIAAAMQDMSIGETFTGEDAQRQHDHNQQIVAENLLTFINLHYQFNIAGCECFGSMAMCPSCNTTPGTELIIRKLIFYFKTDFRRHSQSGMQYGRDATTLCPSVPT